MTIEAAHRAAIEEEAADLAGLAEGLHRQTGSRDFDRLIAEFDRIPQEARSARAAEEALEAGALTLRRRWLDLADAETHKSYRSPSAEQTVKTPTRFFENFGYERELQPTALETRCAAFFGSLPKGWRADHILFSSGQAAMAASLHLAERLAPAATKRPMNVIHAGAYFETSELLSMLAARFHTMATGHAALSTPWTGADIILIEPIFYEGRFARIPTSEIGRRLDGGGATILIFDDTLTGGAVDVEQDLSALEDIETRAVIRIASGLKLLQGGLELANVGIVSLYERRENNANAAMRRLRALLGLGLRFADVAGLEAPWFLNRDYTRRYSEAVFAHNQALATALTAHSRSFECVSHPSVDSAAGVAPFCIMRLSSSKLSDYEALSQRIRQETERRKIIFDRGGSFGFRGHRYDVVSPANAPPFLRVAMGRRDGWSLRGVVDLLQEI
ncbi:hypothetical protein [Methylocystis parvus]|uniref:hypothetical protein n=1 Tax=Methylocystis parvus TaxID=134 RepID=UPI003C766343